MAITFVQEANATTLQTGGSFTITLGSSPANGNAIVVCIANATNVTAATSVTMTGGTFTQAVQSNSVEGAQIFIAPNLSGAGTVITINVTPAVLGSYVAFAAEFSGVSTVTPTDKTAINNGVSTNPDSGTTATTTQANELWIASLQANAAAGVMSAPTNGFTLLDQVAQGASQRGAILYKIVSTTGAANVSVTDSNTAWEGAIATFTAATATNTNQLMMTGIGT